jgi:hypothetical protein
MERELSFRRVWFFGGDPSIDLHAPKNASVHGEIAPSLEPLGELSDIARARKRSRCPPAHLETLSNLRQTVGPSAASLF